MSTLATREIVYKETGSPAAVASVVSRDLGALPADHVLVKFLAAPINPSDINQLQGIYAVKGKFREDGYAVGGNEGVAEVVSLGSDLDPDASPLKPGDWVLPAISAFGTWRTLAVVKPSDLVRLDRHRLTLAQAATLAVNPSTAFRMLHDFVKPEPGSWVVQNGGNSAVGLAVIQIAKALGLRTVSIVRDRPEFAELEQRLFSLGANKVVKDTDLRKAEVREAIRDECQAKLAFNCVSGRAAADLARCLAHGATLVTYGGMSKDPVMLPTAEFIFSDLRAVGYWQTAWSQRATRQEREGMLEALTQMYVDGQLQLPKMAPVSWTASESDEEATAKVREALDHAMSGFKNVKVLLKSE